MRAGELTIELNANIARLSGEMRQANNAVSGFAQKTESALSGVRSAFATLGIGVGFGAIIAGFKNMVDAAAGLDDLAEKTGASVEELSKLEQVARIGGHSIDIAEGALVRLTKALHGTDEESKGAGKALAALGLNADALRGKDTAESLRIVAVELNKYKDGAGKTALALDLLGKAGAQALPFLKDLAEEQGIATRVTAEQAAQAEELQKTFKRLSNEIHGITQALAVGAVPALLDWIVANREAVRIAGSVSEALRLFVFNLDALTSEKPREEIDRLTAALIKFQGATSLGRFMQSPTGALFGGREEDLKKQIEFLKLLERQAALTGGAALGGDTPGERNRMGTGAKAALAYAGGDNKDAEKAAKERLAMLERYRKLDQAGWVAYIEATTAEYERGLAEDAKITEEFYKRKAELDKADQAAMFAMIDAEGDHAIAVGAIVAEGMTENHKQLEKAADAQKKVWESIESTAHDTFINIGRGGEDVFKRLTNTLQNTLLEALWQLTMKPWIVQIQEQVTSSGGGGGGGWIDGIMKAFGLGGGGGGITAADTASSGGAGLAELVAAGGMSFATGTDYVPRTGLAMVHQGERVIPASENTGSGNTVIINPVYNIDSRSDRGSIMQAIEAGNKRTQDQIMDSLNRGGTFAKATGRS